MFWSQGAIKSEACKLIRAEELQAVCACVLFGVNVSVWYVVCFVYLSIPDGVHTKCVHQTPDARGTSAGLLGSSVQQSRS